MPHRIEFAHSSDWTSCVMWLNRECKYTLRSAGVSSEDLVEHIRHSTKDMIDHEHIATVPPTMFNPNYALGITLERYSYIDWKVIETKLRIIIETLAHTEQKHAPVLAFG